MKTAVEWLEEKIQNNIHHTIKIPLEYFEQAKAMEKEQIIDAYNEGCIDGLQDQMKLGKGYYETTFKK